MKEHCRTPQLHLLVVGQSLDFKNDSLFIQLLRRVLVGLFLELSSLFPTCTSAPTTGVREREERRWEGEGRDGGGGDGREGEKIRGSGEERVLNSN